MSRNDLIPRLGHNERRSAQRRVHLGEGRHFAIRHVHSATPSRGKPRTLRSNPALWRTHISNYAKVIYSDLYRGVDAVFYGNGNHLEHDFIVKPGADYRQIRMHFPANSRVQLEKGGTLTVTVAGGSLRMEAPSIYQSVDGSKLLYSTVLGGNSFAQPTGIAVDANGDAIVSGWTGASDFPTKSGQPFLPQANNYHDAYGGK